MSSKKVVVITGATGQQGGSVANFLLNDGTFAVRAITRNPDSPGARELAARGATVFRADLTDPSTLSGAFEGAYGAFCNTNFWEEGGGPEGERAQGKALVDAAKSAGIKHFIWSTLDHSEIKAPHFESKADVDDYLKASGVPRTSFYTAYYFENYFKLVPIVKKPDGQSEFCLPVIADTPFPVYCVADTGGWVLHALKHPEDWVGRDMRIANDFLSYREMINTIYDVTGKKVHLNAISEQEYEALKGNGIPEEIHINMTLLWKYNGPPFRDPKLARQIFPGMKTFRAWVEENHAGLAL